MIPSRYSASVWLMQRAVISIIMCNTWYIQYYCIYMVRPGESGDVLGKETCTIHGISHIWKCWLSCNFTQLSYGINMLMNICLPRPSVALMQGPFV